MASTMSNRSVLAPLLCCALLLCSCSTASRLSSKWEEQPLDGPWIAPGVQAREYSRSYFAGLMHTSDAIDTVWTTSSGARRNMMEILDSVDNHLKKLGYFDRWPESNAGYNGYRQRLAPFTFHVVAIDPTIVLMVPHDFGDPKARRSINDIVGRQSGRQARGSSYMINYIEYGPKLPYHPETLWFSPSLGTAPTLLAKRGDSEQELVHKRIRIVATREGDKWVTRREKP